MEIRASSNPVNLVYALKLAVALCLTAAGSASGQSPPLKLTQVSKIDFTTYVLSKIGTVLLDSSGTIAVGQPQDNNIVLFSGSGKKVAVVGKKGEGPGELKALTGFVMTRDRILVYDNL